jgi:hypothetical protein
MQKQVMGGGGGYKFSQQNLSLDKKNDYLLTGVLPLFYQLVGRCRTFFNITCSPAVSAATAVRLLRTTTAPPLNL